MSDIHRILLVGHCGPDAAMLKHSVQRFADDAEVELVNEQGSGDQAGPDTLLLVNRVLDGDFQDATGPDMLARLHQQDRPPRLMLVSNFDDAQQAAISSGAYPGFGKNDIGSQTMQQRLAAALA
jgi:hypothetical protein